MSKSESASAVAEAPAQKPVWNRPIDNPRFRFKEEQRAWRQAERDRAFAELAAGAKQYQVAIVDNAGNPSVIEGNNGEKVRSLTVGGSSPDEAIGKFCRFAGITGGMENVKIVG